MKAIVLTIIATSFLTLGVSLSAFSQSEKNEIERSIDRNDMPDKILALIDEFWPDLRGIKYFEQTDGKETTYEVKLEWQGDQYSIEFSTEGAVQDVEKLIEFGDIPEPARGSITRDLDEQFNKFRLTRIQLQFIAADKDGVDDSDFIDDILEKDADDYEIRYEIELDGENRRELGSFELLYDEFGKLIEKRRIVRRSLDNIW
jgi:hypothetical protein